MISLRALLKTHKTMACPKYRHGFGRAGLTKCNQKRLALAPSILGSAQLEWGLLYLVLYLGSQVKWTAHAPVFPELE